MAHPKGVLIERLQKEGRQPRFGSEISGPDHDPVFDAEVIVDGQVLGRGHGPNKRTAERLAAEEALRALDATSSTGSTSTSSTSSSSSSSGRRRGSRGGRKGATAPRSKPAEAASDDSDDAPSSAATEPLGSDGRFDGPWPVFESVLATSLRIAHDRVAAGMASDEAREAIERYALALYKNLLLDLGDVVEEDAPD